MLEVNALSKSSHQHPLVQIEGALSIVRKLYEDDRGNFCELHREGGTLPPFVQHNQSFNFFGSLRGMHFQKNNPQGKLVSCLYGTVMDVLFDLRPESSTFMKGCAIDLSSKNLNSVYVPPGVAHGFLTLSRFAVVHYSCTALFDKESDAGVNWTSPEIRELFPEEFVPTVSPKDRLLPTVSEYLDQIK